jgi:ATPase subunit of ABC transporter with duplicated ATPase domains
VRVLLPARADLERQQVLEPPDLGARTLAWLARSVPRTATNRQIIANARCEANETWSHNVAGGDTIGSRGCTTSGFAQAHESGYPAVCVPAPVGGCPRKGQPSCKRCLDMDHHQPVRLTQATSVRVENLTFSYGAKTILDGACFTLHSTRTSCLVGENGVGKTTLLRILARQLEPHTGEIVASRPDYTVAYVPQATTAWTDQTGALDFLLQLWARAAVVGDSEPSLDRTTEEAPFGQADGLARHTHTRDAYRARASAKKGLTSFVGLPPGLENRPVNALSGGQKTRLLLLHALGSDPDLLLLDEPDNNLDQPGRQWLIDAIRAHRGTVLIVGHRESFISQVAQRVLELSDRDHKVHTYTGSYLEYLEHKAAREQMEEREKLLTDKERKRLKAAIQKQVRLARRSQRGAGQPRDKDKIAAKHKSARAAQKHQEQVTRLKKRLDNLPVVEKRQSSPLKIHLQPAECGHAVIRASKLKKAYHRTLFEGFSLRVARGQHLAVVGPNASGKTTLLRIVAGLTESDEGEIQLGQGVVVGYFPQELEGLPDISVLEHFRHSVVMDVTSLRRELSHYQFTEANVLAGMRSLSAGERARVFLVQFALSQANLLLLDEPTNNLDPQSRERLTEALADYAGTMLVISPDLPFLIRLSIHKTLRVGDGVIHTEYGLRV